MPAQSVDLNTDLSSRLTSAYYEDAGAGASKWLLFTKKVDGGDTALGATTQSEVSSGNGSVIQILKRLRTLLAGGLPAALTAGGGVKVGLTDAVPAGTNAIGSMLSRHGEILVLASGLRASGTGQGSDVDFSSYRRGMFYIDCTAATGSPTINFYLQAKSTTLTKYSNIRNATGGFEIINGSTAAALVASTGYVFPWDRPLPATGRIEWTFTAGTNATFSVYFIGES